MQASIRPAERGYAICTSGRSGSNLLCQYLASTGQLGNPQEYFNPGGCRMFSDPDFPDEPEKQIERVLSRGATANGIYGLKILPAHIDTVSRSIRWTARLPDLKFVLLKRRDLLGQAVSALRALQTDQWRSTVTPQGAAVFDGEKIRERLRVAAREYARWEVFFARNGIEPIVVWYEEMTADPQAAVDAVGSLFGLQGRVPIRPDRVSLAMQRDAVSEAWKVRFREEYGGLDELDGV